MDGKKTYTIAILMVVHAVLGFVTGQGDQAAISAAIMELLLALGLGSMRHAIGKNGS